MEGFVSQDRNGSIRMCRQASVIELKKKQKKTTHREIADHLTLDNQKQQTAFSFLKIPFFFRHWKQPGISKSKDSYVLVYITEACYEKHFQI